MERATLQRHTISTARASFLPAMPASVMLLIAALMLALASAMPPHYDDQHTVLTESIDVTNLGATSCKQSMWPAPNHDQLPVAIMDCFANCGSGCCVRRDGGAPGTHIVDCFCEERECTDWGGEQCAGKCQDPTAPRSPPPPPAPAYPACPSCGSYGIPCPEETHLWRCCLALPFGLYGDSFCTDCGSHECDVPGFHKAYKGREERCEADAECYSGACRLTDFYQEHAQRCI